LIVRRIAGLTSTLLLAACATQPARAPAPIVDGTHPAGAPVGRSAPIQVGNAAPDRLQKPAQDLGDKVYTVKPGDTLYSIALENGLDYKEIASWNQLPDVNLIKVGQQLRLTDPAEAGGGDAGVVVRPLRADSGAAAVTPPAADTQVTTVSYPKALKLASSADAATVARQAEGPVQAAAAVAGKRPDDKVAVVPDAKPPVEAKPQPAAPANEEDVAWAWPATGKIITPFSDAAKGIDIGGKQGQPVLAAGAGHVVYAGAGLRGYGKLVIIKHNKTYLSAYAHNSQLLVKEGDSVKKGDKIAEMGNTDADQVKLHFEIRRFGKPVDPTKLLTTG